MNFDLSEDQLEVQALVRGVCGREWAKAAEKWEAAGAMPGEVYEQARELGLFGLTIPESFGGNEYDPVTVALIIEELAKVSASLAITFSVHNAVCAWPIVKFGTEEQRRRFLPALAGGMLGAFSLSEADAGSDAGAITASAVPDGDHYVLNGSKNWVTNGARAGLFLVFARTGTREEGKRGLSAFLVERDSRGLVIGRKEDKMGLRASDTVVLSLEDLRVPVTNRLGGEGDGFKIAMISLDGGRIGVAAQALGVATAAWEQAVRYSTVRKAFGAALSQQQAVQWMIADMTRRIAASRMLLRKAAWLRGQGRPHTREAAMAKMYASESATFVTHRAIQIHGGYGYVKEYPVERFYRDARVMEIYEGANDIQRLVIARSILRDGVTP